MQYIQLAFGENAERIFLCAKQVTPIMKRQRSGTIINISSRVGKIGLGLELRQPAARRHARADR